MTGSRTWPDTSLVDPPVDELYASALWLLGRHPQLAELVERVPGCIEITDGEPAVDLDVIADAFAELDHNVAAEVFGHRRRNETHDRAWEQRLANEHPSTPHVEALTIMSGSERTRLRLLATFAFTRVPIRVADFASLDAKGQSLLADWAAAVCAA